MKKKGKKGWRMSVNQGAINKQSGMFSGMIGRAGKMIKR